jgi:hypothetical protein
MEEPTSSRPALLFNIFLLACNILSNITYCLESLPTEGVDGVWFGWEIFLMTIFTFELMLRAPAKTSFKRFVLGRPDILVDFIACVPFDVYLFFGLHLAILDTRWIRPVRLLRIVKLGSLSLDLKLILGGLWKSAWMIVLVWLLVILVLFSFASILFIAERGLWDAAHNCYVDSFSRCASFDSVPSSLYFTLEVVSSVGYGDIVPETFVGRLITMVLMLTSVCILALTVTVFSVKFSGVFKKVKRTSLINSLREATDLTKRVSPACEFLDASCRLVTGVEILQAISDDLQKTFKSIRADIVFLSDQGMKGAIFHNNKIGSSKGSLALLVERILAELGAQAYNDIDSLTSFVLSATEDLFVDGVGKLKPETSGSYLTHPLLDESADDVSNVVVDHRERGTLTGDTVHTPVVPDTNDHIHDGG